MSYSQNNEETVILDQFEKRPDPARVRRFLDIGAHDGVGFSNTRRLAEMGWGGTLVEPSPGPFRKLMDTYKGRDDVILVNAAVVVDRSHLLAFYDSRDDFVSTFSDDHRAVWGAKGADGRSGIDYQAIYVMGVTFNDLFLAFPGPYPFINLDVEGLNVDLFGQLNLRSLGVEVACVEYQDRAADIIRVAAGQGYARVHMTSENLILVRR